MEGKDLNEIIVKAVLANIPEGIKPIVYLRDVLDISRESVYRRLRSEIPFSVDELSKLALTLGFSFDEIIAGRGEDGFPLDFDLKSVSNASNAYISLYREYHHYMQIVLEDKKSETFMALNEIPALFTILSDSLFKFDYYKWTTANLKRANRCSFSELRIPSELQSLREKIANNMKKVSNVTLILSPVAYLSLIKSIQYYYQRKLLTPDELLQLKNDLLDFIKIGEKMVSYGYYNPDCKVDFYLSTLFVNSNTLLLKYNETTEVHFWIYSNTPLIIQNPVVCSIQKEWFQSLKKHSTLISLSNEILQADFYAKQYEYIETYLGGSEV
jgi:hypothetical protein